MVKNANKPEPSTLIENVFKVREDSAVTIICETPIMILKAVLILIAEDIVEAWKRNENNL